MEVTFAELTPPMLVILFCLPLLLFWLRSVYGLIVNNEATVQNAARVAALIRLCYPGVLQALESGARISMQSAFEDLQEDFELAKTLARAARTKKPLDYHVAASGFLIASAVFAVANRLAPTEPLGRHSLVVMALSVRCITGLAARDTA